MADTKTPTNEQNQREQGQTGQFDKKSQPQSGQASGQHDEKSAIGGGDSRSETGEPGRARNELDQDKTQTGQKSGEKSAFDKNRSEPTGQQR